jgi:hypothetical protein
MFFSQLESSAAKLSLLSAVTLAAAAFCMTVPMTAAAQSLEKSPERSTAIHRGTGRLNLVAHRGTGRLKSADSIANLIADHRGTGRTETIAYRGTGRVETIAYRGTGRFNVLAHSAEYRGSERGVSPEALA